MNWAYQLVKNTPQAEQWIAAPWMVKNRFFDPEFRFFESPLHQIPGLTANDENDCPRLRDLVIGLERRFPWYKKRLAHLLHHDKPDVLHAHFATVGCDYAAMPEFRDIPLIVSFYGFDFQRVTTEKPHYRQRYQSLFDRAAAICTTGPFTPDFLIAQGCPPEKITPIPLSILPRAFPFFQREKTAETLNLVQVATFTEKKGHLDTLAAFSAALKNCPNMHLTFAGEHQNKALVQEILHFVKANQLEQHVTFLDPIDHQRLATFFQPFHVFIHPSHRSATGDTEGSPVVILEAQSTGLPIIATYHADIPAQVLHNTTGLLSPERGIADIASAIERFCRMENDEYQQFSHAASQNISENFDVEKTGHALHALYLSTLVRTRANP